MRLLAVTSLIPVLCLFISTSPTQQGDPATKPTPHVKPKTLSGAVMEEMQGTWRLLSLESPALEKAKRQEVGFLLVAGNYFSFEVHWGWLGATGTIEDNMYFQSGTHRFELDERGRMTASSVIGSFVTPDGKLQFDQPGRARVYDVVMSGNKMTLKRDDGSRYEFEHMVDTRQARDIFGRPLKTKDPGEGKKDDGAGKKDGEPRKD